MDAARELAQLGERGGELLGDRVDGLGGRLVVRRAAPSAAAGRAPARRAAAARRRGGRARSGGGRRRRPRRCARARRAAPPRARAGRPSGARCRSPARRAAAAALTSSGAGVELGVVDDRRDALAVALDRRPRAPGAGLGQLRPVAALVDEDARARAASRRSISERSPRLSASISRTGPSGARACEQQRARERGEQRAAGPRARRRRGSLAASASAHSSRPVSGPSVHGPT